MIKLLEISRDLLVTMLFKKYNSESFAEGIYVSVISLKKKWGSTANKPHIKIIDGFKEYQNILECFYKGSKNK